MLSDIMYFILGLIVLLVKVIVNEKLTTLLIMYETYLGTMLVKMYNTTLAFSLSRLNRHTIFFFSDKICITKLAECKEKPNEYFEVQEV